MIDRKRPRLARAYPLDPQRQTVLAVSLFATPVLTQYAHIAKTRPPFPRRFAAFYENSKKKMKKPSLDCLSAPSILESRAARAGTADRAGLAPRTDRRAHANPSDWSGRDSNEMFGATYVPARDRRASHARRTRDRPRRSDRSSSRAPGFFQTEIACRRSDSHPRSDPARRASSRHARVAP